MTTVERFFFAPVRGLPFAVLRIGLAATLLAQALQVVPVFHALYHHDGFMRGPLLDAFHSPHLPALGQPLAALSARAETAVLAVGGALYLGSLVAMLLGWRARIAALAVWLLHLAFMAVAPHTNYGADDFANIFLFYALFAPVGAELSLDRRAGRATPPPSTSRLVLRVMQLHLCLAYFFSGVEKALGPQWRDGEAIWRSLTAQNYRLVDFTWLAHHPELVTLAGWLVLALEIGYPVFVWPARTRRPWIAAVALMHLGIALFMGLHVFAAVMISLSVALFGVDAEPADQGPQT